MDLHYHRLDVIRVSKIWVTLVPDLDYPLVLGQGVGPVCWQPLCFEYLTPHQKNIVPSTQVASARERVHYPQHHSINILEGTLRATVNQLVPWFLNRYSWRILTRVAEHVFHQDMILVDNHCLNTMLQAPCSRYHSANQPLDFCWVWVAYRSVVVSDRLELDWNKPRERLSRWPGCALKTIPLIDIPCVHTIGLSMYNIPSFWSCSCKQRSFPIRVSLCSHY